MNCTIYTHIAEEKLKLNVLYDLKCPLHWPPPPIPLGEKKREKKWFLYFVWFFYRAGRGATPSLIGAMSPKKSIFFYMPSLIFDIFFRFWEYRRGVPDPVQAGLRLPPLHRLCRRSKTDRPGTRGTRGFSAGDPDQLGSVSFRPPGSGPAS